MNSKFSHLINNDLLNKVNTINNVPSKLEKIFIKKQENLIDFIEDNFFFIVIIIIIIACLYYRYLYVKKQKKYKHKYLNNIDYDDVSYDGVIVDNVLNDIKQTKIIK